MNIQIENEPFPYIIIENFFDESESNLIWKEIDFLYPKLGSPKEFIAAEDYDGTYMTDSLGLDLDGIYPKRKISDILTIADKIYNEDFYFQIESKNEYWNAIRFSNKDYTKLRFYNESSSYKPHRDIWVNALMSITLSDVEFSGGDLYFPCHDFLIETKNNRTVIFPGWIEHGVTEIKKGYRFAITRFIHCAMENPKDK